METTSTLMSTDKKTWAQKFQLTLTEGYATLLNSEGKVVASFPHEKAEGRFVLPSFWQSVKHLGIRGDNGILYNFCPIRQRVQQVKRYLNTALAIQGPEVARAMRKKGLAFLLGGLALIGLALIITAVRLALWGGNEGAQPFIIWAWPVGAGFALAVRGGVFLRRARYVNQQVYDEG